MISEGADTERDPQLDTTAGTWAGRTWHAIRTLPGRTSLRAKLVMALLVLVLAAVVVMGIVSGLLLRGQLLQPYDNRLQNNTTEAQSLVTHYLITGTTTPAPGDMVVYWIPANGQAVEVLAPESGLFGGLSSSSPDFAGITTWPSQPVTVPAQQGGGRWRALGLEQSFSVNGQNISGTIVIAEDASAAYHTLGRLAVIDTVVGAAILFVLAVVGFALVQANLRPLVDIEETAGEIAEGHLERRVPERDPRTEIGSLGRSLNTMLSQIESAFHAREESEAAAHQSEERMRRFIADASHELRTPLTAIRGFAEYYRQRGGLVQQWDEDETTVASNGLNAEDLDRIMHRVEAEAARMGLLVEDLLLLARMDQQRPLARNPVDLLSLAADAVHDMRMIAPNRPIDLKVQPGAAFLVVGDEPRLRQVIGNLMSNALKHTPEGTPVDVSIKSGVLDPRAEVPRPAVILDVRDQGPGMAPDQAQRVFERFYRADQARTRATGGSGLGLAIVAAIVAAHGGVASVRTAPGRGATFRIALPLAPEAEGSDDEELPSADDEPATNPGVSAEKR